MESFVNLVRDNALFWIALSIGAFEIGRILSIKFKSPVFNPLMIAIALIIAFLQLTGMSVADYNTGGNIINLMLAPATAALAYSVYEQRLILKRFFIPVLSGCIAGSAVSIGSVYVMCRLFSLSPEITAALIPKSVTTPIAIDICSSLGGLQAVTVAAVIITGILGAILAPIMIRIFKISNPVAAGTAIGACSHAVGTTKAVSMGETEGAMSAVAIGVCGIATVLITLFF